MLEPVNAVGSPTPPGEPSHTVLISNLANRVQPILRYDLGDSVVEGVPGIEQYQIVQTGPESLRVRLRVAPGSAADAVWRGVQARVGGLLADHGLGHVTLERAAEPPEQSPGGQYRPVIPLEAPA